MSLQDYARFWNVTPEERKASYPCDSYLEVPYKRFIRAVDVEAPPEVLFRWLCQLKVAPYSYDWIDNDGQQSPRELTPGAENLEAGQTLLVFQIVDYELNHHISGVIQPSFQQMYDQLAVSYVVQAKGENTSRLVANLNVGASGLLGRLRRGLLAWGDLIMTRKQLRTLKHCAERIGLQGGFDRDNK